MLMDSLAYLEIRAETKTSSIPNGTVDTSKNVELSDGSYLGAPSDCFVLLVFLHSSISYLYKLVKHTIDIF